MFRFKRRGFTSVGAACQRTGESFMDRACSMPSLLVGLLLRSIRGILALVLRRVNTATRRLNSSLRSHRVRRSLCRRTQSGLDKTLYASAGPNSHSRGHRRDTTPVAAKGLRSGEDNCSPGRIKPARGHRLDGASAGRSLPGALDAAEIPHAMTSEFSSLAAEGSRGVCRTFGPRPSLAQGRRMRPPAAWALGWSNLSWSPFVVFAFVVVPRWPVSDGS